MGVNSKKSVGLKKLNRKQTRKNFRKEKKAKKNEWYTNRDKKNQKQGVKESHEFEEDLVDLAINKAGTKSKRQAEKSRSKVLTTEEQRIKEQNQKKKLLKEMEKQRKDQLLRANEKEDQTIKKLEKQLKLHKRKTKNIPKSFSSDGLDFLLEVCDPEYMSNAVNAEKDLNEVNDDFEEDLALMTGQYANKKDKKSEKKVKKEKYIDEEFSDLGNQLSEMSDNEMLSTSDENDSDFSGAEGITSSKNKNKNNKNINQITEDKDYKEEFGSDRNSDLDLREIKKKNLKSKKKNHNIKKRKSTEQDSKNKKMKGDEDLEGTEEEDQNEENFDFGCGEIEDNLENDPKKDGVWEDIYGRLRAKDGSVINSATGKYIPPAIRSKMMTTEDKKRGEKLLKLKRQLKGLLNRLAESNMHSIASQIEALYMNNSRNDMNETLTSLMMDSLVSNVATPERLLMEHILLVTILHANVGTEIGAHFLQTMVKKFDDLTRNDQDISDKTLDNIVNILAQLYNFKVFEAKLLYEILQKLSEKFYEKNIDCILHVLKNVGFGLRKDDPVALKNLILELQKQAATASEGKVPNSRVKFLLDILMAIKNNNMTKIPNYDPSYSQHLKKIMKGFIRKGNYVTQLNISLEDLLKADERGKWWVVGSAWTGKINPNEKKEGSYTMTENVSQKLLDLAKKQRMNTDSRRDIFCIIMTAEDYVDAFEKLLKLGLKNQQEREIIHVILHCCLQEKVYNPYYAVLAQKFCEYDRKFQMTIKYSIWDKLKTLNEHSGYQISNLAKLLTYLFIEKGLPISTLKIVEFSELDKTTLRFIRQILLGILLHTDSEPIQEIFLKIAHSEKLKMFRESLRLFIHHFVLRNLKTDTISEENKTLMEERAGVIEKILSVKESRLRL